jgi:hypothetical protein
MRRSPLVLRVTLLASLVVSSAELAAQQSDSSRLLPDSSRLLRGTAVGVALDRYLIGDGGRGITAVSLRVTGLNPGRFGVDFAASTYLPALAEGVMLLGLDLGGAYNLSGANGTGLLRFGASTIIGASANGGGAVVGGYVGAGLVARVAPRLGVRTDITKRLYIAPGVGVATVWTVSVGLTSVGGRS